MKSPALVTLDSVCLGGRQFSCHPPSSPRTQAGVTAAVIGSGAVSKAGGWRSRNRSGSGLAVDGFLGGKERQEGKTTTGQKFHSCKKKNQKHKKEEIEGKHESEELVSFGKAEFCGALRH